MARPRKIRSVKAMEEAWNDYKHECNNRLVTCHDFSAKNSEFVSADLRKSVTYTIEGFCIYLGLARSAFYETYENDPKFSDIVMRVREECEVDAREKFELGIIPPQLSALWMSKYGYTTKAEDQITGDLNLNIEIDYGETDSSE